jgi:hypothetical protein
MFNNLLNNISKNNIINNLSNNVEQLRLNLEEGGSRGVAKANAEKLELLRDLKLILHKVYEYVSVKSEVQDKVVLSEKDDKKIVNELEMNLEKCLWHGLKKSLLFNSEGNTINLYTLIKQIDANLYLQENTEADLFFKMKNLIYVNNDLGRSRAFVRLCLNNSCLHKVINFLLTRQPKSIDAYYHKNISILGNQETCNLFVNMITGLNGIEFDLNVDDELLHITWPKPSRRYTNTMNGKVDDEDDEIATMKDNHLKENLNKSRNEENENNILASKLNNAGSSNVKEESYSAFFKSAVGSIFSDIVQKKTNVSSPKTQKQKFEPFGKSLPNLVKNPWTCNAALLDYEIGIPNLVLRCLSYLLQDDVLNLPELFTPKVEFDNKTLTKLKDQIVNEGFQSLPLPWHEVKLNSYKLQEKYDPFAMIQLLKAFFRQLPVPLIPYESYDAFIACIDIADADARNRNLKCLVDVIPKYHLPTFVLLVELMYEAGKPERFDITKGCDFHIVADCFSPAILRPELMDNNNINLGKPGAASDIIALLIEHKESVLENVLSNLEFRKMNLASKVARCYRLHRELRIQVNPFGNDTHEQYLKRIWEALTPNDEYLEIIQTSIDNYKNLIEAMNSEDDVLMKQKMTKLELAIKADFGIVSDGWIIRGFNTTHAAHDLRGGGVVGLKNVAYFVENFKEKALNIVSRQNSIDRSDYYPFVQGAMQMSLLTFDLLGLASDKMDLNSLAVTPSWNLLNEENAIERVFTMSLLLLDNEWVMSGDDVMVFNRIKSDVKKRMNDLLNKRPESIDKLWQLWIEDKRMSKGVLRMEEGWGVVAGAHSYKGKRGNLGNPNLVQVKDDEEIQKDENEEESRESNDEIDEADDVEINENVNEKAQEEEGESYLPNIVGEIESKIYDKNLHAESIESSLPSHLQGYDYEVIFSTLKHGENLPLFYEIAQKNKSSPNILIVKDTNDNVFGAFNVEQWAIHQDYFGTGESFLFSFKKDKPFEAYFWSGKNNFIQFANDDAIGIGGGGDGFGLFLDGDFSGGTTACSETFSNQLLSNEEEFDCKYVELWILKPKL